MKLIYISILSLAFFCCKSEKPEKSEMEQLKEKAARLESEQLEKNRKAQQEFDSKFFE